MANRFRIPPEVEKEIRDRDKFCVYCHKKMICPWQSSNRRDSATIEHLREIEPFYWTDGITGLKKEELAICCGSCNSSRGVKKLEEWFQSLYCTEKEQKINEKTVAKPVKDYLER